MSHVDDDAVLDLRRPAPPDRTSPRAIAALVYAVLVLPLLSAGLPLCATLRQREGLRVLSAWTDADPRSGATRYWVTYADPDGSPRDHGPSDRPVTGADLPEAPLTTGRVGFMIFSVFLLVAPLVLEVLALVLGVSAVRRLRAIPGAPRGRGLAIAAIVVAALNVVVGACLVGLLALILSV